MPTPWTWQPEQPSRIEQPVQWLRLDGADTRRFLHGQTSAAIDQAAPGAWIPTCCISPTGRMRALAEVLVDRDGAWLVIRAGDGAAVRSALDRVLFPADQVSLGPLERGRWITPLGPEATGTRTGTSLEEAASPDPLTWQALPDGSGWRLGEHWLLAEDAAPPAELAGSSALTPLQQERWRIQQGLPALPAELNDDTNPFELGLTDRVSLTKGCYVGQETLAKLATYDGVKQQLRRWHWTPAGPGIPGPASGAVLVSPEAPEAGRLGTVTSALQLEEGDWIGLALVRRRALEAGTLQLGTDADAPCLTISTPDGFLPPPLGAGSQAR